jgi:DNA polymerase-3 subunit delta'
MPFERIAGHQRVLGLLQRSIAADTLPPSLIFVGPEGVGKRTVAISAAQALNCEKGRVGCGTCSTCRRIARGVHSDVQLVLPGETGSIKIEQIRGALDQSMYRPFEGRRRVTIVDEAHALMVPAQNALLKTLEEPPSTSVFMLVTSRPDALLPTVRSRCSLVRFSRLSAADVAQVLERDHQYSARQAAAVAAASDGSIGRALAGEADEFADARGDAEGLLRASRQRRSPRDRIEGAKDLVKGGGGPASAERDHLGLRLHAMSSIARDLGLLASGGNKTLLANGDLQPQLEKLGSSVDAGDALRMFEAIEEAQEALERNVSPKVVADWLALHV